VALPTQVAQKSRLRSRFSPFADGEAPSPEWHPATLAAFRFGVIYFGLYVLTTQMLGGLVLIPGLDLPPLQGLFPFRNVVLWFGTHVFGIAHPVPYRLTGSGDRTFDWLHVFTLLSIAVIGTVIWGAVARDRDQHAALYRRFRVFLRFALGTTMLGYGMSKAIPLQMPIDSLTRLVEPFGNFSPMGVLWYSIGASPSYEMFVGLAEICGGLLLMFPLTAPLGALMCLMNTIEVFTLNMTYDVPVKLFAFHLVLMSAFLVAPNAPRLFDFFIRRRATAVRPEPALGATPAVRRRFLIAQLIYVAWAVVLVFYGDITAWKTFGAGAPKSAFYGIWSVDQMTVDGQPRPAVVADTMRWRRVIFQRPTSATLQRMNDAVVNYAAAIDTARRTLTLTAFDSAKTVSPLTYQRPTKEHLLLDGMLDGRAVHLELSYHDPNAYLQRSRGFHWISEVPFNR
jgi:hypothetical protein